MKATQIFGVALVLYGLFSLAVTFGFYRADLGLYGLLCFVTVGLLVWCCLVYGFLNVEGVGEKDE